MNCPLSHPDDLWRHTIIHNSKIHLANHITGSPPTPNPAILPVFFSMLLRPLSPTPSSPVIWFLSLNLVPPLRIFPTSFSRFTSLPRLLSSPSLSSSLRRLRPLPPFQKVLSLPPQLRHSRFFSSYLFLPSPLTFPVHRDRSLLPQLSHSRLFPSSFLFRPSSLPTRSSRATSRSSLRVALFLLSLSAFLFLPTPSWSTSSRSSPNFTFSLVHSLSVFHFFFPFVLLLLFLSLCRPPSSLYCL